MRAVLILTLLITVSSPNLHAEDVSVVLEYLGFDRPLTDAENAHIQQLVNESPADQRAFVGDNATIQILRTHAKQIVSSEITMHLKKGIVAKQTLLTDDFHTAAIVSVTAIDEEGCDLTVSWGTEKRYATTRAISGMINHNSRVKFNEPRIIAGHGNEGYSGHFRISVTKIDNTNPPLKLQENWGGKILPLPPPQQRTAEELTINSR